MHVSISEAQTQLAHLIELTLTGIEVIIDHEQQPLVRLQSVKPTVRVREFGRLRGMVKSVSADFDAPLEDFQAYMS